MMMSRWLLDAVILASVFALALTDRNPRSDTVPYHFESESTSLEVLVGEPIEITCTVRGLNPGVPVLWLNQSFTLGSNELFYEANSRATLFGDVNGDVRTYTLQIHEADPIDEGEYRCQIPTSAHLEQIHHVVVNIPAEVTMDNTSPQMTFVVGDTASFTCTADGKPEPTVKWIRMSDVLPNGESYLIGDTLELRDLGENDSGVYQCSADNGVSQPATATVEVQVLFAPDVFLAQEIIHTGPGLQELMECVFRSNPPVEVVWTHNDRPIDFEERSNLRLDTNMQARHEIISVLQINNLKDEDLGTYRCEGGNQIAIATEEIYISALPHKLEIVSDRTSAYSDQYTLQWWVSSVPEMIEFYLQVIERNETGDYLYGNNTVPAARSINSNTVTPHEYTIEGLHANGSYLIKLYGRNEFGNSEEVDFEFFTPSAERLAPEPTTAIKNDELDKLSTANEVLPSTGQQQQNKEDRSVVDNAADSITAKLSSILTAMLAVIFIKMWRV